MIVHGRRSIVSGALAVLCGTLLGAGLSSAEALAQDKPAAAPKPPPVESVQALMDEVYRAKTTESRVEMKIVKPSRTRTMRMKMWTEGQERSLIVLESPARDKGTATLKVDDNLWNYLPKISRTMRIPPSMMLGSWMGSDFTNDDLVKDASYKDDFIAAWAGESKEPDGWILRMTAKPGKVGLWKRIDMVVSRDGRLPLKASYYDRKDRLARTMYFEDIKMMGGRKIPTVMRIVPNDKDKPGEYTMMTYLDLKFDVKLPGNIFSLTQLKRGR